MIEYIDTVALPEYAICYIAYGHTEDICSIDKLFIDEWLSSYSDEYENLSFDYGTGESYFCDNPEFGLACKCIDVVMHGELK